MKKKMKRQENWMFNVPNNATGKFFMYLFNKYLNKETYMARKRPRGERTVHAKKDGHHPRSYDAYLPVRHANRFQVYMTKKTVDPTDQGATDTFGRTSKEFLDKLFEHFKICDECGQGQVGHSAIFVEMDSGSGMFRWEAICADGSTYRPSFS